MSKPTKAQLQKSLKDALDQIKTLRFDLANAGATNVSLRSEIQKLRSAPPKEKVVEKVVEKPVVKVVEKPTEVVRIERVEVEKPVERVVRKGREEDAVEIARLRAVVNKLEREANAK